MLASSLLYINLYLDVLSEVKFSISKRKYNEKAFIPVDKSSDKSDWKSWYSKFCFNNQQQQQKVILYSSGYYTKLIKQM